MIHYLPANKLSLSVLLETPGVSLTIRVPSAARIMKENFGQCQNISPGWLERRDMKADCSSRDLGL